MTVKWNTGISRTDSAIELKGQGYSIIIGKKKFSIIDLKRNQLHGHSS